MRQSRLPQQWLAESQDSSADIDEELSEQAVEPRSDVELWTRVIPLDDFNPNEIRLYDLSKDLEVERNMNTIRHNATHQAGRAVFDPDTFKNIDYKFNMEDHRLTQDQLLEYASVVTQIRGKLDKAASLLQLYEPKIISGQKEKEQKRVTALGRSYLPKNLRDGGSGDQAFEFNGGGRALKKKFTLSELSAQQLQTIVDTMKAMGLSSREAAERFGTTERLAQVLLRNHSRTNSVIQKKRKRESKANEKEQALIATINSSIQEDKPIWKAAQIAQDVKDNFNLEVDDNEVTNVLKGHFNMRYRMVKPLSWQGNSNRCMILRQLMAMKALQQLSQDKRIIVVDQTWFNTLDHRTKKWRQRGVRNSNPRKALATRVSVILACDSRGKIYISFTRVNTDTDMMVLYFSRLARVLTKERNDWRTSTIIQFDGASYMRNQRCKAHLENLGFDYLIASPYMYDQAAPEYVFAWLKRGFLNPDDLPTGKNHFRNIIRLICLRAKTMKASQVVRLFHHTTLELFHYLYFRKL